MAHLTKKLKLNSRQRDDIKPILEDREARIQTVRQDDTLTHEARTEKTTSILQETGNRIEAVLDNRQRQAFEKDEQAMRRHLARRSAEESSFDDSPPPPDDDGGPPDGGPPPDGGGPPDGGPPGW